MRLRLLLLSPLWLGLSPIALATDYTVAESGGDFTSIQAALDIAVAGDTISVHEKATPYFEKISFPTSGNALDGHITLQAFPGESPVLDGTSVSGTDMVRIVGRSYVKLIGFEIRNNLGVNDGSGVRILGSGSHIEIRDNRIHEIRGSHAMGITVYGTDPDPISELVIDGNEIYDCDPFQSEALTLNGNVTDFQVTNNIVRDVNNIGIDFIGGETDIQPDPSKVARNGVCRGNQVYRANEQGGGYAGGIYVDGGRDIVIENNIVSECDLGIEIGAENSGTDATNITVRNNLLYANQRACIVFGGFQASVGRTRDSRFSNNTCYKNDTLGEGVGELWIQYAQDNVVENNIFYSTSQNVLVYSESGNTNNQLDYNLWYAEAGPDAALFVWKNTEYQGFAAYQSGSGQDPSSLFADPALVDPDAADFHLGLASPAIDGGNPAFVPDPNEVDLDGAPRLVGAAVDVGADEAGCGNGSPDPGEECDDGNQIDGDGCDSNCSFTACGNDIVTAGEQCDDGNLDALDCCDPSCQFETSGSSCDDGNPCTQPDTCQAGVCSGAEEPEDSCREPIQAGKALLKLRDRSPDSKDRLLWKWGKGAVTSAGDLGDPVNGSTAYTLCMYDESGGASSLALRADAPAGGTCAGKPCWKSDGGGYQYKDKDLTPGGLLRIKLRPGGPGQANLRVSGKGLNLGLPGLPLSQDTRVTVQLKNTNGVCWSASYGAPAIRNDSEQFKDRSD